MKKEEGVTLIALIITIIVLIILAGVSISFLAGDDGIVTRAINSDIKYAKAEVYEKLFQEVNNELVKAADYAVDNSVDISSIFNEKILISLLSGIGHDDSEGIHCLTKEPTAIEVPSVLEDEDFKVASVYIIDPVALSSGVTNCGKGKKLADKDVFTLEVVLEEVTPQVGEGETPRDPYQKSTGKFDLKYYDKDGKAEVISTITLHATNKN